MLKVEGKKEHIYVKADFPAIVSDELWKKAQEKKARNSMIVHEKMRQGKKRQRISG